MNFDLPWVGVFNEICISPTFVRSQKLFSYIFQ